MAFSFPRPNMISKLSLVAGVLLVFGLGLTVFGAKQQHDNRSQAATTVGTATNPFGNYVIYSGCIATCTLARTSCENFNPLAKFLCSPPYAACTSACSIAYCGHTSCSTNQPPPPASDPVPPATAPSCSSIGGTCQYSSCGTNQSHLNGSCDSSGYMVCCTKVNTSTEPSPPPQQPPSSGGGDSQYIGRSCSTPQGSGSCQYRNSYNCSGSWVTNYCPGSDNVVCCVPPKAPAATIAPQACGDTEKPTGGLISQDVQTSASATYQGGYESTKAVDGDQNTSWNAGNYPPQWIELNLGSKKTVTGLKLFVNQDPNGTTKHQILTGENPNPTTVSKTLDCVTGNNQTINVVFDTPLTNVQYIRVNTPSGVSWVAWKEIEVYGESNKAPTVSAGEDKTIVLPTTGTSITGTASDPDGDSLTYQWTKVSGPAGGTIQSPTSLTTDITNLQEGEYIFKLTVSDGKITKDDSVKITVTTSPTTTLKFDLLVHGIGKAGDNANTGESGGGTKPPVLKHLQRLVDVELVSADNKVHNLHDVLVKYDTQKGSFTGSVTYDKNTQGFSDFESGIYAVYVKFPQSLKTLVPPGFTVITRGVVNTIPQLDMVTGDINGDNKLSLLDYSALLTCYSDFEAAEAACTAEKKAQADLTDDGNVNIQDLNLFLRELSVQGGR